MFLFAKSLFVNHVVVMGFVIRFALAWALPILLDRGDWIPGVKYTDIDYYVFTDASVLVSFGKCPFERHTYRYTPFLAVILRHVNDMLGTQNGGRYLFCVADVLCGWLICQLRQLQRKENHESQKEPQTTTSTQKLQDALWWMYNPFAINICTRGSAESFMVLLPVLWTIAIVYKTCRSANKQQQQLYAVLAGILHGVAVHSKLYPIIYSLSYMAYLGVLASPPPQGESFGRGRFDFWKHFVWAWFQRLTRPLPILFFVVFVMTSTCTTWLGVHWYGPKALQEGLLYHFGRLDHRHNYSMFWYSIYLTRGLGISLIQQAWLGRFLLLPQLILLVYSSLGIGPYDLTFCLFLQTFMFVTFNKVITAQYFTWYLCLLPLCSQSLTLTRSIRNALIGLGLSIVVWLACAYCLEMQGMAVHRLVWLASVCFFVANVNLLRALLQSYGHDKNRLAKASVQETKKNQ